MHQISYRYAAPALNTLPKRRSGPVRFTFIAAAKWLLSTLLLNILQCFDFFGQRFESMVKSDKEKKIRTQHFQTQRYKKLYSYKLQDASKPGLLKKNLLVLILCSHVTECIIVIDCTKENVLKGFQSLFTVISTSGVVLMSSYLWDT